MQAGSNIAVLISGRGSNLKAILNQTQNDTYPAKVVLVISNVEGAAGLELARQHAIPALTIKHGDFASRQAFDQNIHNVLLEYNIDWVLLAGFMRILSDNFVQSWMGKLINIHPSLLPLYPGLDTHARALAAGDSHAGASVHFVTQQLDGGPVILQGRVDIAAQDNAESLAQRVLTVEHIIYPMALDWLLTGRASLQQNIYYLDGVVLDHTPVWYKEQLQSPERINR